MIKIKDRLENDLTSEEVNINIALE